MPTDIETAFREIAGFAPDQDTINRLHRAGRTLRLQDQDSGWLLLAVLEAHNAAIRDTLNAASTLAAAAGSAADDAGKAATAIAREAKNAGPVLARSIQDSAIAVGSDLRGTIDQATGAARKTLTETIATGTIQLGSAIAKAVDDSTEKIQKAATDLSTGATEARDRFVADWQARAAKATSETLAERIKTEAARSRRATLGAFTSALAIAAIAFGVSTYIAHRQGWQNGYRTGKADLTTHLHNQKIRASWANTPDGKLAFQLYNAGFIRELATCSGQGWKTEIRDGKPLCLPYSAKNGTTYGWFLQ